MFYIVYRNHRIPVIRIENLKGASFVATTKVCGRAYDIWQERDRTVAVAW